MQKQITKSILFTLFLTGMLLMSNQSKAQFYSVKTNVLEVAAMGTLNADVSMMIHPRWTVNVDIACNPWTYGDNLKMKHWLVEPGARYWFWQTYTGSFLSMYGIGTRFNVGMTDKRYDGYGLGVGATYGYAWAIAKRWNVEAEAGAGLMWSNFSINECRRCGETLTPNKNYLKAVPKLGVSMVYLF